MTKGKTLFPSIFSWMVFFLERDATMWKNCNCSSSSLALLVPRRSTLENNSSLSLSPMWASTRTPDTLLQLLAKARPISDASSGRLTTRGLPPLKISSLLMANEPSASTTSLKSCMLGAYTGMLKLSRFSALIRPYNLCIGIVSDNAITSKQYVQLQTWLMYNKKNMSKVYVKVISQTLITTYHLNKL